MLLKNEKHEKWHKLGPVECRWEEKPVTVINVTRSTMDNEQFSIAIPVFQGDSRVDLENRVGLFLSIAQDRMTEANEAWRIADEKSKEEMLKRAEEKPARLKRLEALKDGADQDSNN